MKLLVDDSGQGLVEYAVILSAGLTVMMAALSLFAGNASATITAAAHDFSDAFEFQSYQ